MSRRIKSALLGTISLVALGAPAYAVETVVVTAEKRAENIQDVPMSISVLGGGKLEREIATSFEDYVTSVPGMNYTADEPGHTRLILRGINAGGVGSTIGTYLDETPYGSSSALANGTITTPNLDTFDIARIEVLRGPQGTIYGASTLGGLLKFVTNAPNPAEVEGKFEAGASDLDNGGMGWSVRGMLNVPLADNVALRVVAYHENSSGYIDDPGRGLSDLNSVHSTGGRASLLFNFSDDFSVRLNALVQDLNTGNDAVEDQLVVGATFSPLFGKYQQQRVESDPGFAHYRVFNGTAEYDFGWASLLSTTSFGTFRDVVFQDGTGVLGAFIEGHLKQDKVTQEVRLISPDDNGPIEWLAGFYYTNEIGSLLQNIVLAPGGAPLGFLQLDSRYIELAGFANLTYHFTDQFEVTVGGRYSHNKQRALQFGLASAAGASEGNVFTWSVAPAFKLDEQTNIYARVAKGFRPGGPNALPPVIPPGVPTFFGSDFAINYEAGVKTTLLDGALTLDAAVFMIDWEDIQLLVVSGGFGVNANGGTARSQGVEWSIAWNPVEELGIVFNGAYTDAHLTSGTDPLLVGAASGAPLPYAPRWSTSLDADYTFDSDGGMTPFIGFSWRYIGERHSGFGGFVVPPRPNQFELPSYNTIAARVGVDWDNWTVQLYGKNLGNAHGITAFGPDGISAASGLAGTAAIIAPRELGLVVRTNI